MRQSPAVKPVFRATDNAAGVAVIVHLRLLEVQAMRAMQEARLRRPIAFAALDALWTRQVGALRFAV